MFRTSRINISKVKTALLVFMLILAALACRLGAETAAGQRDGDLSDEAARQLKINKEALLNISNEDVRVEAALALLMSEHGQGLEILLENLNKKDNTPARIAICRAISKSRGADLNSDIFIEPLLGIIVDEEGDLAKSAAEALTVYDYNKVGGRIADLVSSAELDRKIRLNALYALKLRPDKEAVSMLITLLDDPDGIIAQSAENALQESFGYPVGTEKKVWRSILKDLPNKSRVEIMKDRMASQMNQILTLKEQLETWKKLSISMLDSQYEKSEDPGRAEMIAASLASDFSEIKMWALDRVQRRGSTASLPLEQIAGSLKELISDPDMQVRTKTAKVLSKMSEVDPAKELLLQLKSEQIEEVRLVIFQALGEAIYFALSPGSKIKLEDDIRDDTLDWAGRFLASDDGRRSSLGAEVVRKILELNGLEQEKSLEYLQLISDRYIRAVDQEQTDLRISLLEVMGKICAQGVHRGKAAELYRKHFTEGLGSADEAVRRVSLAGLRNVDRSAALNEAVANGLHEDSSAAIRSVVIALARDVGKVEDIRWLAARKGSNGEPEALWRALVEILNRQNSETMLAEIEGIVEIMTVDRRLSLYELAEKKASNERQAEVLSSVRFKLADMYFAKGSYDKAAEYYHGLLAMVVDPEKRNEIEGRYLESILYAGKLEETVDFFSRVLADRDFDGTGVVFSVLDQYFNDEKVDVKFRTDTLNALLSLDLQAQRPQWQAFLKKWSAVLLPGEKEEGQASKALHLREQNQNQG